MSFSEELSLFRSRHPYRNMLVAGANFRYVYEDKAQGPTLVFLNGGTNVSEMWMRYVEAMSGDYKLLIFDYPRELKDNRQLVRGMHEFFEALGIKKPVLIGASDGGMVAQIFTQEYPEELGALVLIATGGMDERTLKSLKRKYFFTPLLLKYMEHCNYEKLKPKLIKMGESHAKCESPEVQAYVSEMFRCVFADYTKEKDLHITGLLADLMNQKPVTAEDFRRLKGKIMLILPSDDFFSPQMHKDLAALMFEPRIRNIQGGHISTVIRSEEFIREIRDFLERLAD